MTWIPFHNLKELHELMYNTRGDPRSLIEMVCPMCQPTTKTPEKNMVGAWLLVMTLATYVTYKITEGIDS